MLIYLYVHWLQIGEQVKQFLLRVPVGLQEVVTNLVSADTRKRTSTHFVASIGYFADPAVQALQFLDVIAMKDPSQKSQFFRTTLTEVFPFIPRASKVTRGRNPGTSELGNNAFTRLRKCCRQVESEVVSNSRKNITKPRTRTAQGWPKRWSSSSVNMR